MLNATRSENADPDEGTALKAGVVKDSLALTSPIGKRVIAVLAVAQALLLLAFYEMVLLEWGPFQHITFRTVYLTLVIAVPAALYLLLDDPRKPRPWWYSLGLA